VDKFDVAIVGAGPAGATAAYILAKAGLQVVVIERGQSPGSKNVSGGLIFSQIYNEIYPNFWEKAPIERAIRGHGLLFLGDGASTALDFRNDEAVSPPYNAFSVLRAKFDPWLANLAEEAGAMIIPGYTVDELMLEDGRVCGLKAGGDELPADVVIVAEGTRSQLLKKAGLMDNFHAKDVSLGVKEIIQLSEYVITERFLCNPGEGMAYTTVGSTAGVDGGGFLYTNKDTLSLGVVVKIESLYKSGKQPHQVLNEFKAHPTIARMISGGKVVEYSAQTVHRGGFHLIPQLYGDGYLVAGSAARLLLNNVMTLRGMDLAVASAAAAAKSVLAAKEKDDFSAASLASYGKYFQETSVYKDIETFKATYPLMENKRLFNTYPDLICNVMEDMFSVKITPAKKAFQSLRENMKDKVSFVELAKDLFQIGKGIAL
jgi:electron transfer flavoprotein-quinone oxidoreductase